MNYAITKIICKKSIILPFATFREGIEYNKFILETEEMSKIQSIPYKYKYIYIYADVRDNIQGGTRFHLDKDLVHHFIFDNFYEYFYDNKEIRKLKLNKLNKLNT